MTIANYTENMQRLEADLVRGDLIDNTIVISAAELLAAIKNRIFRQGKNSAGSNIGNYSTEPIYVSKQMFAKPGAFAAQGKSKGIGDRLVPTIRLKTTGIKKNAVNYKNYTAVKPDYSERKTMYLENGYKELRDVQGLETGFVDFKYRGDLLKSYGMQKIAHAVLLGITDEVNSKKRKGLERKFGETFPATQQEKDNYISRTNQLITRLTRGYLTGVTATIN